MNNILIVEDDKALARGISLAMEQSGYKTEIANDIKSAERILLSMPINLILLDINLPDGNGLDLCRKIRKKSSVPILMLTINDMEIDEVAGLEAGADDYIRKPFSLAVLRARVQSVIRRMKTKTDNYYETSEFVFDFDNMIFSKGNTELTLSKTEQKLLKYLIANKGNVLSRDILLDKVWSGGDYVDENALSVTVKRLREKLEDDSTNPHYIKTVYGIGYQWIV